MAELDQARNLVQDGDDAMLAMKEALFEIKVECKRAKDGCSFLQVPISDIDNHEKDECEFRPVRC